MRFDVYSPVPTRVAINPKAGPLPLGPAQKAPAARCRYDGCRPEAPCRPGCYMVAVNLCASCKDLGKPFNERLLPKRVA